MSRRKTRINGYSRNLLDTISRMDTACSPAAIDGSFWVGYNQAITDGIRSTMIDTAEKNAEDAKGER